ncbi:hypothetical protein JCM11491_006722 [Sporobolomyces phaffii]
MVLSNSPSLPLEVLRLVLDSFKDSRDFAPFRKLELGRNVALTGRAVRDLGTSLVWSTIEQRVGVEEGQLRHLLKHERVASFVRVLVVSMNPSGTSATLSEEEYRRILPSLPSLRHLELVNLPRELFDCFLHPANPALPLATTLRCIKIYQSDQIPPDNEHPPTMLALLTKIRTLKSVDLSFRIPGDTEEQDLAAIRSVDLDPLRLDQLRIELRRGSPRRNSALLNAILDRFVVPEDLVSLRIRCVAGLSDETWVRPFPRLETFLVEFAFATFANHLPAFAASIPKQPRLRALYLRVVESPLSRHKTARTATAPKRILHRFLDSLPDSLERLELAITFPGGALEDPLHAFLEKRKSMPLEAVCVVVRTEGETEDEMEYRGVAWITKERLSPEDGGQGRVRWKVTVSPRAPRNGPHVE